eukprot:270339_1
MSAEHAEEELSSNEMDIDLGAYSDLTSASEVEGDEVIEPLDFIPDIKIEAVSNGVIRLQITNCEAMWEKNRYETMHDIAFEFVYRKMKTNKHDTNTNVDQIWRQKKILVGNTGYYGTLYCKFPVYLLDYNIEFSLRCRNCNTNQYMTPSTSHTVNIPSFLLNNNYRVNDVVSFRDNQTFYTSQGTIVEILDDNKFKIFYYKYNEDYDTNQAQDNGKKFTETYEVIHISRIYHKGTDIQYEIDLIDSENIVTNLLIQRSDSASKEVFHALVDVYNTGSLRWCLEAYGDEKALCHWEAVSCFIAKNVYDFLYEAEYRYKVDCLLDGDRHCGLELRNLRQSDIRTKLELQRDKIGKVEVEMDEFDELSYRCDCCRTGLRDWHFVYQCSIGPLDRHDFCLNCVNTVITLNTELRSYLDDILNKKLNNDCIQVIVSYVFGRVVCL